MSKISRVIPFSWWPANWGLTGERRDRALAEYHWDGEDLAYRLLDLQGLDEASREYRLAKIKLDYKYHKLGEYEYGLGLIDNDPRLSDAERARQQAEYQRRFGKITEEELAYRLLDVSHASKDTQDYQRDRLNLDVRFLKKSEEEADHELLDMRSSDKNHLDYTLAQLALELKWGNITKNQYEKEEATLKGEPWFNMLGADQKVRGDNVQMAVELDWNEFFVEFLESKGWTGATADEIVDNWFEDAMKQMLDIYEDDLDDGSADPMPMAGVNRVKRDDGLTEYT